MKSESQKLTEYFQQNKITKFTHDPADEKVIEDPRDSSMIICIGMLIRPGTSKQKLKDTAKKIQSVLDKNGIVAMACIVEGGAGCTGIQIMSEHLLPKSLGIRSEFDGVPVGFEIVDSLDVFGKKPAPTKKPPGFKP